MTSHFDPDATAALPTLGAWWAEQWRNPQDPPGQTLAHPPVTPAGPPSPVLQPEMLGDAPTPLGLMMQITWAAEYCDPQAGTLQCLQRLPAVISPQPEHAAARLPAIQKLWGLMGYALFPLMKPDAQAAEAVEPSPPPAVFASVPERMLNEELPSSYWIPFEELVQDSLEAVAPFQTQEPDEGEAVMEPSHALPQPFTRAQLATMRREIKVLTPLALQRFIAAICVAYGEAVQWPEVHVDDQAASDTSSAGFKALARALQHAGSGQPETTAVLLGFEPGTEQMVTLSIAAANHCMPNPKAPVAALYGLVRVDLDAKPADGRTTRLRHDDAIAMAIRTAATQAGLQPGSIGRFIHDLADSKQPGTAHVGYLSQALAKLGVADDLDWAQQVQSLPSIMPAAGAASVQLGLALAAAAGHRDGKPALLLGLAASDAVYAVLVMPITHNAKADQDAAVMPGMQIGQRYAPWAGHTLVSPASAGNE
jgi:hypothetical protein